jgi:glycerophosphoryl diester phosphodiesterase
MRGVDQPGRHPHPARRSLRALVALCGLAALMGAAAPVPRPLVAAHRGGALLWPENSLTAFRHALALGVDYLETDVHLTSDGEVVVLHDPTFDRTTTDAGRAARLADHPRSSASGPGYQDARPPWPLLDRLAPGAQLCLDRSTPTPRFPDKTGLALGRGNADRR